MPRNALPAVLILVLASGLLWSQAPGWKIVSQLQTATHFAGSNDSVADVYGNSYTLAYVDGMSFLGYPEFPPHHYQSDKVIWKLDSTGNTQWIISFENNNLSPRRLGTDGAGCLYYTAGFWGTVTLGDFTLVGGSGGKLIAKLDPAGNYLWVKDITGSGYETAFSVGLDGSCFFTGTFNNQPLNFGDITLTCEDYEDMYVARMNSAGDWVWARQATGWREVGGNLVAAGAGGECYVSGRAYDDLDLGEIQLGRPYNDYNWIFVAKYSAGGVCLWAGQLYRPLYHEYFLSEHDLVWDGSANALLLYSFDGDDINASMRIRRFGPGGTCTDVFTTGTSGTVGGRSFSRDAGGNLYLLGSYTGPFTMGGVAFTAVRGTVLMKLSSSFNQVWAYDPTPGYYNLYRQIRSAPNGRCFLTLGSYEMLPVGPYHTAPEVMTCNVIGVSPTGEIDWLRSSWLNHIGSEGTDVFQDPLGNNFICGNYEGGFIHADSVYDSYGASGTDLYAARLDGDGNWLWISTAGGTGNDAAAAVVADANQSSYLTGSFTNSAQFGSHTLTSQGGTDAFVAKLDGQGNWLWAVSFGGLGADAGKDIVTDSQGNLYVTGTFSGSVDFGAQTLTSQGGTDIYVLKLGPSGLPLAVVHGGGDALDLAGGLVITPEGKLALCAAFCSDAVFGERPYHSQGGYDILVALLSDDLQWLQSLSAGGSEDDLAAGIDVDAAGNLYLAGTFSGSIAFGSYSISSWGASDAFAAKLTPQGAWRWASSCGSTDDDQALALATDPNGTTFLTGYARGNVHFGNQEAAVHSRQDILTAALDQSGNWLWLTLTGQLWHDPSLDQGDLRGSSICLDELENCIVTGKFSGNVVFANIECEPLGAYDTFVGLLRDGVAVSDPSQAPAAELNLLACPNPFSGEVGLTLELARPGSVTLKIYNLRGELVRALFEGPAPKGTQQHVWDGRDDAGRNCPAGLYLLSGESSSCRKTLKLIKY